MATHSSILAWKISWAEKPGRLQSMGSQTIGHNWVTNTKTHTHTNIYIYIFQISPHYWLLSDIEYSFLCYTAGPYYLFYLKFLTYLPSTHWNCTCQGQNNVRGVKLWSAKISSSPMTLLSVCCWLSILKSPALNSPSEFLNLFLSFASPANKEYHLPTICSSKIPRRHPWVFFIPYTSYITYTHTS